MSRVFTVFAGVVMTAAVLFGAQQPAGAVSAGVLVGGGGMTSASGPSVVTGSTAVSGTISWTIAGTTLCSGSNPFNGFESLVQGNGGGGPFGCWPDSCGIFYNRVVHEIVMNVSCAWSGSFQLGGFAEPDSALPTTGFNFQVAGVSPTWGPVAVNGNISFSPSIGVGVTVDPGTLLPTPTGVTFSGSLTGLLGPGYIGSCTLNMAGGGVESFLLGTGTTLAGTCNGGPISDFCVMNIVHVATQAMINGNCSGPLGFTLVGTGEMLLGSGGGYTLVAAVAIL